MALNQDLTTAANKSIRQEKEGVKYEKCFHYLPRAGNFFLDCGGVSLNIVDMLPK